MSIDKDSYQISGHVVYIRHLDTASDGSSGKLLAQNMQTLVTQALQTETPCIVIHDASAMKSATSEYARAFGEAFLALKHESVLYVALIPGVLPRIMARLAVGIGSIDMHIAKSKFELNNHLSAIGIDARDKFRKFGIK